jgi:DNA-binding transcriptional LysR family regulator
VPLIVDDVELVIRAALEGIGLSFVSEGLVESQLKSGELIRVLDDWCQPFPGFFLYYPSRRQQPAALAALIDTLKL